MNKHTYKGVKTPEFFKKAMGRYSGAVRNSKASKAEAAYLDRQLKGVRVVRHESAPLPVKDLSFLPMN